MSDDTTRQPPDLPWVIVGYGRVGQALTLTASRINTPVRATWNRTETAANDASVPSPNPHWGPLPEALDDVLDSRCIVWLTVVDDAIAAIAGDIAGAIPDGSVLVHTSGSLPSTLLAEQLGTRPAVTVASLHPLQAISDPTSAVERFPRSFWTIEGDDEAVDIVERAVAPAGIEPIRIEPDAKVLYHASAATAANLLVSLLDASIAMAESADIDRATARKMLVELAESSLANLADNPPRQALTGPAARGDLETIDRHKKALDGLDGDSLRQIYDVLTDRALDGLADE